MAVVTGTPSFASPGSPSEPERWRVSGSSLPDRLDSWSGILAETHVAFDVEPTGRTPEQFRAGVTRRRVGDLELVDLASAPFVGYLRPDTLGGARSATPHEDVLAFQLVCKGVERVCERGRELILQAGDVLLWDALIPTEVEIIEPFYKRTLMFPRELALSVCPRLEELEALPLLQNTGPARLLVRYVNALAAEMGELGSGAAGAATNAALELLRATIEPALPTTRAATREAMRTEIRRYVRTRLQDPLLGPASIARTYAMSVRALHALFEDAETSVAGLVRTERLVRCMEDLRRPNGGSVTEIAFRWGFCDAAHFSRVFKREFGATPSEIRHAGNGNDTGSG